jgi:tRNA threonylcarbamoyladenosine dehydratase
MNTTHDPLHTPSLPDALPNALLPDALSAPSPQELEAFDFERRFGGLRRLYGARAAQAIFDAHIVVVGIGGVGSWTVEALARSGVRRLSLIDLDHISESNINRQIHAQATTLGQAKVAAMRERIHSFHPGCVVDVIDEFVSATNASELLHSLGSSPNAIIDACDQVQAKTALAAWAMAHQVVHVCVGAAGGKTQAHAVEVADVFHVTHDPLLAQVRYRLRKHHGAARNAPIGVTCVFTREAVTRPAAGVACDTPPGGRVVDANLNCHGYGSVVTVTASLGLAAAGHVLNTVAQAGMSKNQTSFDKAPKMPL